jgi:hypothetical protein
MRSLPAMLLQDNRLGIAASWGDPHGALFPISLQSKPMVGKVGKL